MTEQLYFEFDAGHDPDDHYTAPVDAETALGDPGSFAVVEAVGGVARSAQATQFYHKDGFFEVRCSEDLPAQVIAAALLMALQVVEPVLDERYA